MNLALARRRHRGGLRRHPPSSARPRAGLDRRGRARRRPRRPRPCPPDSYLTVVERGPKGEAGSIEARSQRLVLVSPTGETRTVYSRKVSRTYGGFLLLDWSTDGSTALLSVSTGRGPRVIVVDVQTGTTQQLAMPLLQTAVLDPAGTGLLTASWKSSREQHADARPGLVERRSDPAARRDQRHDHARTRRHGADRPQPARPGPAAAVHQHRCRREQVPRARLLHPGALVGRDPPARDVRLEHDLYLVDPPRAAPTG